MFTEEQNAELAKNLHSKHVKQRSKGNFNLSYIEGWHAIDEANRIFGFGGWSRETIYCMKVCEYEYNGKHKVGYEAKVRITVNNVTREGTGNGSGIAVDLFDAYEGASKEAETDAMKRALMTFGNQFGLALYDKEKAGVTTTAKLESISKRLRKTFELCKTPAELEEKLNAQKVVDALEELTQEPELRKGLDDYIERKQASFN